MVLMSSGHTSERHGAIGSGRTRNILGFLSYHYTMSLFIVVFAIPALSAILFYGVIASDRYISESKLLIRGVTSSQTSGLSVLLKTFGISRANDDSYAIQDYILSRDVLRQLMEVKDIKSIYQRPEADFMTKYASFSGHDTFEDFYKYYLNQVDLVDNVDSGIVTLKVSAYRPEDAKWIADNLLVLAEKRVNSLNERARSDSLKVAMDGLDRAEKEVLASNIALTNFRQKQLLIDPSQDATSQSTVIAGLTQKLVENEVALSTMKESASANPGITDVQNKLVSLRQQIDVEQLKLSGSDGAIANKLGDYEALQLKDGLANKGYELAANTVSQAQQEAARKQIYLEAIVQPNLPDKAIEPRRLRYIGTIMLLAFSAFVMLYLLVSGSREHLNIH